MPMGPARSVRQPSVVASVGTFRRNQFRRFRRYFRLARLAKRDGEKIRIAVRVPSELEPAAELAVMGEKDLREVGGDDPRRARHVSRTADPLEAVGARAHEVLDRANTRVVLRMTRAMGVEDVVLPGAKTEDVIRAIECVAESRA